MGIIGYPLGHTLSPVFQQAALEHAKLDIKFAVWPTAPEDLATRVQSFRSSEIIGCCITLPHKQTIIPLLDFQDATARDIGAVNWVTNKKGKLTGHNTDATGFLRSLKEEAKFDPSGTDVIVFGAGGAARAVAYALREAGVARLTIANRTIDNAVDLAASMTRGRFKPRAIGLSRDELSDVAPYCKLLVNTSSMGMAGSPAPADTPVTAELIAAGAIGYDVVYAPLETPFLREVDRAGGVPVSGLSMLLYQGAEGFELCTGVPAPVQIMMAALKKARGNK